MLEHSEHYPQILHLSSAGITLTFIENSGLLETAENLGLLSAAADRWKLCSLNLRISPLDQRGL